MIRERILYTDGHEVTVTDSFLRIKKSFYDLKGITKHGYFIIHPDKLIPYFILLVGIVMIALGATRMMPEYLLRSIYINSIEISMHAAAIGLGIALCILSALLLLLMKDRYAIWIVTAEGEKNVVVSRKREYVKQILDALNHAFFNLISPSSKRNRRVKEKG